MKMAPLAVAIAVATGLAVASQFARAAHPAPGNPAASPMPASVTDTSATAAAQLFAALRGRWSCAGGFANGRALAADLSFTPAMNGKLLRFRDADHAPSSYVQEATGGLSAARHQIVSLAFAAGSKNAPPEPALYVARSWTARSLTLVADTLESPPWAPNRFTYTVNGRNGLKMVWEVERNGAWRMGDTLSCHRAAAQG
jgi:hypothetical protein